MWKRSWTNRAGILALGAAFCAATHAEQSGSVTLSVGDSLNLETGAISARGDIAWSGTAITPLGRAALYNLGKKGPRVFKFIPARSAAAAPYSDAPIPASSLVAGDIFGVRTNRGAYAKVMVTAASSVSIRLQYSIFASGRLPASKAAAGGPVIAQLQNNYSYLLPDVPNYGIAPGSLFIIVGTGLSSSAPAVLQSSAAPGLPLTLNQTSVSVTVAGVTTAPALYYTSSTQLAAVLPSATPAGTGTITVTYQGTPSSTFPIRVVESALGLDTLYGTGTGAGVATDANGKAFGLTNSAMPGQEIVLWGSGVGADSANDDRSYPQKQDNLTNIPMTVLIGGIPANVIYRGRSQYPGVDQINVMIPANVTPGCYVSAVAQSGPVVSNVVTLPVSAGGGTCTDSGLGYAGSQLQALAANGTAPVDVATFAIGSFISGDGGVSNVALAALGSFFGTEFGAGYAYASEGSCVVNAPGLAFSSIAPPTGLDGGTIQVTGPGSAIVPTGPTGEMLQEQGSGGFYAGSLNAFSPGTYTFTTSGGKDVKALNVPINVNFSSPFAVVKPAAGTTIQRSAAANVNWTGGFTSGGVIVTGGSFAPGGTVGFMCTAPAGAGQFSIPSAILLSLPPGAGKLSVLNLTAPQSIPGLPFSAAAAVVNITMPINFN